MSQKELSQVEDGLLSAHEFIESVQVWTGHEDGLAEALGAVEDALDALRKLSGSPVPRGG